MLDLLHVDQLLQRLQLIDSHASHMPMLILRIIKMLANAVHRISHQLKVRKRTFNE